MTNALLNYSFEDHLVRIVQRDDGPWFVGNDLCAVLDIKNARDAIANLDEDEKGVGNADTLGGRQELNIVSESGMFSLIFRSRKPEARRFRKWVTGKVLPELRRTGRYAIGDPDDSIPEPGAELDPVRLNAFVAVVREGRRLWGPEMARHMWIDLGLPIRLAEIGRRYRDEQISGALRPWLAENPAPTLAEATGGVGLDPESDANRTRVAKAMRGMGWWNKRARRGHELVWAWFPPETLTGEARPC